MLRFLARFGRPADGEPWRMVHMLAVTQLVSYGTLFYAIALLASGIRSELGWSSATVFGAFSLSLLVAGLASTPAGVLVDRHGGARVMAAGSLLAGLGLFVLAAAQSVAVYFAGWALIGLAMALVLYEAAFAAINREFAGSARRAISVLTLYGGFASTVFWPLTLYLDGALGWRNTLAVYGGLQLLLCLPLHLLLPARRQPAHASADAARPAGNDPAPPPSPAGHTLAEAIREPVFWKLALAFSTNMFIFSAMSVHVIPLLQQFGHALGAAVFLAALIGPMQVAGRLGEMALANRLAPAAVGRITFALLPAGLLALLMFGERQYVAALFCVLYGMSNGILTIVRGTVPLELFGRRNYGAIAGALAGPSLFAKAAGPLALAALVDLIPSHRWLVACLLGVALISLAAFLAAVRERRHS